MLNLRVKLTYSFALGHMMIPTIQQYRIFEAVGTAHNSLNRKTII
jgi:hypothetical protein